MFGKNTDRVVLNDVYVGTRNCKTLCQTIPKTLSAYL